MLSGCAQNTVIKNVISKDCTFAEPIYYNWEAIDRELEAQLIKHNASYECECLNNVEIDESCKATTQESESPWWKFW